MVTSTYDAMCGIQCEREKTNLSKFAYYIVGRLSILATFKEKAPKKDFYPVGYF